MKDPRFPKLVLFVNSLVPGAMLAFDAWHHQLGPDPINEALHITGKLALIFLVLTLAVTPVRRLTGYNALSHFRRMLGLFAFFYALTHFCIYFRYESQLHFSELADDLQKRPFIQYGLEALLLMVPLAITSTNGMIKRLGGKNWKTLHKLVYVSAVLGIVHYCMNGKVVTLQPKIFAAVIGLLLAYRIYDATMSAMKRKALKQAA